MSKVAIVFWSATGNTETMANCIAEGAGAAAAASEHFADAVRRRAAVAKDCRADGIQRKASIQAAARGDGGIEQGGKALTDKQRAFLEAYIETEDIRQAALCAGYTAQSAFRMGQRALKNPEVRTQALWHGAPVPDETAEETLQRRIAAMTRGGELKAGEQFRAMEMLYKLEKQRGQAGEERVKTVRFEGALEQWSR